MTGGNGIARIGYGAVAYSGIGALLGNALGGDFRRVIRLKLNHVTIGNSFRINCIRPDVVCFALGQTGQFSAICVRNI